MKSFSWSVLCFKVDKGDLTVDQATEVFANILKQPENKTDRKTILRKVGNYFKKLLPICTYRLDKKQKIGMVTTAFFKNICLYFSF